MVINPNSAVLFNAFLAGPEALDAVDDAVLADPEALEDLHTVANGLAANLFLEEEEGVLNVEDRLEELRAAIRSSERDPQRARSALKNILVGMNRWPAGQGANALARTRRAFSLFAEPAAVRETANERLGRLREGHPMPALDASSLVLLALSDSSYPALQTLIERAEELAYLYHLSLLATHSPELFESQHIDAMRAEAQRLQDESILQREVTKRQQMVRVSDRLTALADQLQRQLEAK